MRQLPLWLLVVLCLAASPAWSTTVVYDNTSTEIGAFNGGLFEYGDELTLAPGPRTVSEFRFRYAGNFGQDGDETVRIRFYANDGSGGEPGTQLYDSGTMSIAPVDTIVTLSGLSTVVPDVFTWTWQFAGIDIGPESVLNRIYHPPTVGSSDTLFWRFFNGGWIHAGVFGDVDNFYAQVTTVPEPSSSLLIASGLLALGLSRRNVPRLPPA